MNLSSSFPFHNLLPGDILITFNIPSTTYLYYTGSFYYQCWSVVVFLLFLTMILSVESLSDNDERWVRDLKWFDWLIYSYLFNVAVKDWKHGFRGWPADQQYGLRAVSRPETQLARLELRYPEFMGYQRFYPLFILFWTTCRHALRRRIRMLVKRTCLGRGDSGRKRTNRWFMRRILLG